MIGLDANVIFQTIGMVIGGRHPGFYFLDEAETSDLVGTNTKPHYYIVGPSQISFFFFTSSLRIHAVIRISSSQNQYSHS